MPQDKSSISEEERLLQSLYLILLYISGGDEHNEYLATPYPESPNSSNWHSKETFVHLNSWIGLDFEILDQLEEEGFLEQPQKGGRKPRSYIQLNKNGMKRAREILKEINLTGAEEALLAREHHEDYINHKTHIDLVPEEYDIDSDNDEIKN
ncbi:DUF6429 family protein [Synechococcus sp. PCC 6312]|uniref:DUF6429 family protein n=1 Tax=Synechococcus sp. (strain ATCC 27167 / PCC 6312) TaxID=195253 RepID=UPI00029ECBA3|nr:DUF6429 family protein [Synechococcus sp. PCC 6312]AFY62776.1 hypothetical protein Syn6312_3766 [Synechococcus sp. PCC 6312]